MRTKKKPIDVLKDLVDTAITYRCCGIDEMRHNGKSKAKVGEIVQNATPEERELLKELTSDEAAKIRPDISEIKFNQESKKPNYYVKPK